jgi:hypothetical protein
MEAHLHERQRAPLGLFVCAIFVYVLFRGISGTHSGFLKHVFYVLHVICTSFAADFR